MPTVQFDDIPFALRTPVGSLDHALPFNAYLPESNPETGLASQTGVQWMLDQTGSGMGAAKRLTRDNKPQAPGEIIHRKYRTGLATQLRALAVVVKSTQPGPNQGTTVEYEPACGADVVDLFDLLSLHLHSIENTDGRLFWLPSSKAARMVDRARWMGSGGDGSGSFQSIQVERDTVVFTAVQFGLLSPFPYAIDAAEIVTCLGGATPHCSGSPSMVTITNGGTSEMWPVVRVYPGGSSPLALVELDRLSALTGETQSLVWNGALPGAPTVNPGHFIEFDFFRETAYVDGNLANAKPGIDVLNSDFWPLEVGNNTLSISGAAADVLWQDAWTG